jgi:membrane protein
MSRAFLAVLRRRLVHPLPLVRYLLLTTETHALCGSLAFFAMLGFYPLGLLLVSLATHVLRSQSALEVVRLAIHSYYPMGQDFLLRNLELSAQQLRATLSLASALWILLGGAGVFIPLETAFNRLWGFTNHRSYWHNQLVGFLLTLVCWLLVLALVLTLALAPPLLRTPLLRLGVVATGAAAIFVCYRLLPHGRVEASAALPAAIVTALAAEAVRFGFSLLLPRLDLPRSQGPFHVSVSFLVFVYVEAFVLLAGAFLAAETTRESARTPEIGTTSGPA